MPERPGIFAADKHPVMSLSVQAVSVPGRAQGQFEVLVRHLFSRFFHNELLAAEDEMRRVMQIAYAVALPTLLFALFLYPAYHAFPPNPYPRPLWPQTADHYFFVMYSFVAMGAATVYEWDLLFPDLLDVFVLSVLPISSRRLFFARVLAVVLFLTLVLVGTGILGNLFLPLVADRRPFLRHFFAHSIAIAMSGTFGSATFLALQGILLNLAGERVFRRLGPLLQGLSLVLLLVVLLLFPTLSRSLRPLMESGSSAIFYFPPFWFLGVYERLLDGPATLPVFKSLAHIAIGALLVAVATAVITYPIAYRRRVRQLIEGASATRKSPRIFSPLQGLLHRFFLRTPSQRAVFHFVSHTILRAQRQRVMLAMYGGLATALALSGMIALYVKPGHIGVALLPDGIRAAVPVLAFWSVAGLSNVVAAPVHLRGVWLFHVIFGRPRLRHLDGTRLWITLCASSVCIGAVVALQLFSPPSLRRPLAIATQMLVAVGLPLLLADIYLFSVRTVPFTQLRRTATTDLPLTVLRYVVLFPVLVRWVVRHEPWMESSVLHLAMASVLCLLMHRVMRLLQHRYLNQFTVDLPPEETEEFPQGLGLRST